MRSIILYLPFVVSWAFLANPSLAFWVAWSGSLLLFVLVLSGALQPAGYTASWLDQPLRPLFIPHFIFAGYMSLSSIFYFWSLNGYEYFTKVRPPAFPEQFDLAAQTQVLYYLGHAALVHGLLVGSRYVPSLVRLKIKSIAAFSIKLAIAFTIVNFGLRYFPQLSQFSERTTTLSAVAAAIALALAIPERQTSSLLGALFIFGFNLLQAVLSGWKENILVLFILLGAFLLPVYRAKILLLGVPLLLLLLFVLPTFNTVFRANAWEKGVKQEEALRIALDAVQSGESTQETNWAFLVNRFSEINIFTKYLKSVPEQVPYYGTQIIEQSIANLFPRVLYPNKPITEDLVMVRVRENRIIEHYTKDVSAKPQIVVDGYLSFGLFGAWLFCFMVGWSGARISVVAEQLFGGYFLGTGIIFSSLFNVYWRGNCLEFFLNTVVWSMVIMVVIYYVFQMTGIIDTKAAKAR